MMPRKPPSPCTVPGCSAVVERGRCAEHRRQRDRARGTPTERGYGARWQRTSARYLRRHPWCAWPGCTAPATQTDHVVRRRVLVAQGVTNPDSDEHLQGLCHPHHSEKTARETGLGGAHDA
jgi:5-methylcytosine-specific restriction protein A